MAVEGNKKNDEAKIQRLLDDGIRALRDKNIEGVMVSQIRTLFRLVCVN